ncbi:MAG: (d)CMP kinase [Clostridia bacterium]|nr:(d)CMP kinase [Clostridia bacterium]
MTFEECIEFLYGDNRAFSKPGLSRIEYMLKCAGDPEKGLRYVHVAGTNGKGSCASMVASVLASSGLKTGLYISPDVSHRFEGIKINGRSIANETLAELVGDISGSVKELDERGDPPTAFEIITACVFLWFYLEKCDFCVVECGMGGAQDATNVIPAPECCVLMNIGLDHVKALGASVAEIAQNKAGIIKKGCDVVFYGGDNDALKVIKKVCRIKKAKLTVPDYNSLNILSRDISGSSFDYGELKGLCIALPGRSQIRNACCAVETVFSLRRKGFEIGDGAVRTGLSGVRMPGRFEVFSKEPAVIFDGAHNVDSVKELTENLDAFFPGKKVKAVYGVMADKNYPAMLDMLAPRISKLYAVTPSNSRALDNVKLAGIAREKGIDADPCGIDEAIGKTVSDADKNDVILITGSLYLYKDVFPFLKKETERKEKNMNDKIITVAIDGPSGAGKSTVAKAISSMFGIGYLDTGAMYRTVALFMDRNIPELAGEVEKGAISPETAEKIVSMLDKTGIEVRYDDANVQHVYLGDEDVSGKIRTPLISMEASKVSAIPEVRVFLVDMQREIGSKNSIVMDGRDIGTHVLTDASVKIFLTASPEERARRRYKELVEKGSDVTYEDVLKDIIVRDYGDSHRAASPLKQAEDAILLDTTELNLEESVAAAMKIVKDKTGAVAK